MSPQGVSPVKVAEPHLVARLYQETRERMAAMVTARDEGALAEITVPACPRWSVRDVLAHVTATAEDCAAGRLTGPPTDDETAAQVQRFDGHRLKDILAAWSEAAQALDEMAGTAGIPPPLGDIVSHEHDIRGALGQPGARDISAVGTVSDQLLTMLRPPVPLRVVVEDAEYRLGPDSGAAILLRTNRFEAIRWRTGRRSRRQLAAMDWSDDPSAVLDHLYLFGPADNDVDE